ncbi:MAG: HAMP domain-containing protein, partial [Burkholderiaceae bacterium]|nr:HAMP domain-containing protein [Burkholderiaceae bacterium]
MTLTHKMLVAPLTAIVLMAVVAAVGWWGMQRQRVALHDLREVYLEQRRATNTLRYELAAAGSRFFRLLALAGRVDDKRIDSEREALMQRLRALRESLGRIDLPDTQEDEALVKAAASAVLAYMQKADQAIDIGSVDANTGLAAMMSADEQLKAAAEAVEAVGAFFSSRANAMMERTERLAVWSQWIIVAALGLAVIAAALLAVLLARRVTAQLQAISAAATALAGGDLKTRFNSAGQDEVAAM